MADLDLSNLPEKSNPDSPSVDLTGLPVTRSNRLGSRYRAAQETNPDDYAKAVDLEAKTSVPARVGVNDLKRVEKQVEPDWDRLRNMSPKTMAHLDDDEFMQFGFDDITNLSAVEQALRSTGDATQAFLDAPVDMLGSFVRSIGNMSQFTGQAITDLLPKKAQEYLRTPLPEWTEMINPTLQAQRSGTAIQNLISPIPADRAGLHTEVASGLGQVGSYAAVTMVNPLYGMALMFAGGADQAVQRAELKGATEEEKAAAWFLGGLVEMGTEKAGLDYLMKAVPPAFRNMGIRWAIDTLLAGGVEATEEWVAGNLQDLVAKGLYDPDQPIDLAPGKNQELASFIVGALFRNVVHTATKGDSLLTAQERANKESERLSTAMKAALESKVRERSVDRFNRFAQDAAGDNPDI